MSLDQLKCDYASLAKKSYGAQRALVDSAGLRDMPANDLATRTIGRGDNDYGKGRKKKY
jgi:uncharacterized caspase-like protein